MKQMNDEDLDKIIMMSVKRHKAIEQVNRGVMMQMQRRKQMMWLRLVLVAFGVPMAFMAVLVACLYVVSLCPELPVLKVCMSLPVIAMALISLQIISKISLKRV